MAGDNVVLSTAAPTFPKTLTIQPGSPVIYDANGKSIAVNVLPGGGSITHGPVSGLTPSSDPAIVAAGATFTVTARELLQAGGATAVVYNTVT